MFGKAYLSLAGEGVAQDETLRAFGLASFLCAGNAYALVDYGYALDKAERWAEARRCAGRALARAPWMLRAHLLDLEVVDLCRYGRQLLDSTRHMAWLEHLAEEGVVNGGDADYLHCLLRHTSELMRAGRLEEAIARRAELLAGLEASWTQQTKVLRTWQTDPATFAQLYAREAALRGDPGRVVQGFSAAPPDSASELAMLVEALLALGDDDLALVAYAHKLRTKFVQNPIARLAGAKALLANGDLAGALDCIHGSALRFPTAGWDTAHDRLLRAAASAPLDAWEAVIDARRSAGARRLAKLVARDAADFAPGAAASKAIAAALELGAPVAFDAGAFAALRSAVAPGDAAAVDAFFAREDATLEAADRLVNDWTSLLPPGGADASDDRTPRAAKLLYVFASAFGRYVAATTRAPSVLAGAYRQIAGEALEALRSERGVLPRPLLRGLFEGVERFAPAVDSWLLDTWLLRVERALDLEATTGHLAALTEGLPVVRSLLRGDEQIAVERHAAERATGEEALALLERCVRATGRGPASRWSELAAATLPPEERLDLHLTASFIANNFAGPAVEAAKILLAKGAHAPAFEELCTSFGNGGAQWRDKQLVALAPLWAAAKVPLPLAFEACFEAGMKGFQTGDMATAREAHRWLAAMDPNNAQVWKNL
ncbi:MAG TPA: hypothetical protein VHB21_10420, partial [Minicystis sp.]|nr:hypothetical protein [Minicystis sp.]